MCFTTSASTRPCLFRCECCSLFFDVLFCFLLAAAFHNPFVVRVQAMFGDVRFVLMCGSASRAQTIAQRILEETDLSLPLVRVLSHVFCLLLFIHFIVA